MKCMHNGFYVMSESKECPYCELLKKVESLNARLNIADISGCHGCGCSIIEGTALEGEEGYLFCTEDCEKRFKNLTTEGREI